MMVLPLLALGACATGPGFGERMAALVGHNEADLVQTLGVPVRTHEADGLHFLQFEERRAVVYPAPDPFPYYGPFGRWRGAYAGPAYGQAFCDVTWSLRNGRAEAFTARGDCS
jgi:hypothetical protein